MFRTVSIGSKIKIRRGFFQVCSFFIHPAFWPGDLSVLNQPISLQGVCKTEVTYVISGFEESNINISASAASSLARFTLSPKNSLNSSFSPKYCFRNNLIGHARVKQRMTAGKLIADVFTSVLSWHHWSSGISDHLGRTYCTSCTAVCKKFVNRMYMKF